jgi:hypothetical protein
VRLRRLDFLTDSKGEKQMKYEFKEPGEGTENEIPAVKEKSTRGKACPLINEAVCSKDCSFFGTQLTCRLLTAIEKIAESA